MNVYHCQSVYYTHGHKTVVVWCFRIINCPITQPDIATAEDHPVRRRTVHFLSKECKEGGEVKLSWALLEHLFEFLVSWVSAEVIVDLFQISLIDESITVDIHHSEGLVKY